MTIQKIEAHSPESQSADLVAENIAKLKALFPELVTETAQGDKTTATLNVEVLKGLIGDATAEQTEEKYGLNWHGKRHARQMALTPSTGTGTLRPCPEQSVDWETTQNLLLRRQPYLDQAIDYTHMSAKKNAPRWIKQLKAIGKWPTASAGAAALAAI